MNVKALFKQLAGLTTAALLSAVIAAPSFALFEFTEEQRETIVELVEQLEERHYAKLSYDDNLSAQHLDAYLEFTESSLLVDVRRWIHYSDQSVSHLGWCWQNLLARKLRLHHARTTDAKH